MLGDICFYLKHHSGLLDLDNADTISVFVTKIIASHYLKQADFLRALTSDIGWRLTRRDEFVFGTKMIEAQWSDIQSLERRIGEYCEALEAVMIQLKIPLEEPNMQKAQTWSDVAEDFQFLLMRFKSIQQRAVALNAAMTGLAGMAGNRQSLKETKTTKTLTVLGLIFIPLAYTASLFSMAEPYAPGSEKFWLYFAISIPLIALLMGTFYLIDAKFDRLSQLRPRTDMRRRIAKAINLEGGLE